MSTVPDFPARPAGRWVSEHVYEFDAPIEMSPGQVAKAIDFSHMDIPEDMTREQVIEAITDPHRLAAEKVVEYEIDIPISCPVCGKKGTGTLDATRAMIDMKLDPADPEDRSYFARQIDHLMEFDGGRMVDKQPCDDCR